MGRGLQARARLLAQDSHERRVLVLCFNVSLAAYLRASLSGLANVAVWHFDGWCKSGGIVRAAGESNASLGGRLLGRLADGYCDSRSYDAVLVDEAQDFDPSWFTCALAAMKEPDDGDLLIVGGRQQGIFGKRDVTWSRLGVRARGRSYGASLDLDRNYRNTAEILALAARFARDSGTAAGDDGFGVVPVDPAKCVRRGLKPFLARCRDRADECRRAVEMVRRLLQADSSKPPLAPARLDARLPREIGILYPRLEKWLVPVFQEFLAELRKVSPSCG